MGIVTKNYLLKDINRDYLDMIAKDYNLDEDKAEFVIKGFTLSPNDMKFDDGESSSIDVISTKSLDRDGEIVDPNGVVFDIFRKHPICVWCHDYKQLPIGKSAWIKNSAGEAIVAKTIYAVKSNPLAAQIYQYRKDGFPLGKSMGFVPVDWEDCNPRISKGLKKKYHKVIMLEYSDVPMPSNPDALQLAVSKGLIKQDYPKMFYFHDLDIKQKDYVLEFDEEEKEDMSKKNINDATVIVKELCPICNSEQDMIEFNEEFYTCKGCGEKKKKKIVEKIAKREDVDSDKGEEEYGDVEFADEKNKKYPIDTEEHVRAALSYWGMQKNREKYSTEDQESIGKKIRAAAKKLGIGTEEKKEEKKEIESEEIVQKRFMDGFPSMSDIMNSLYTKVHEDLPSEDEFKPVNPIVIDVYPISYPNGKFVFQKTIDEINKTFSADYTYNDGKAEIANISEVKEAYVKKFFTIEDTEKQLEEIKGLLNNAENENGEFVQKNNELEEQLDEYRESIEYLSEKVEIYSDEIERLKEIEEELIVVKEGRVLSGKNRKLISDCIFALQVLMDATDIVGKDCSDATEDLIDIIEKDTDESELNFTKEDISEITKKAISMINMPKLDVASIVDKVEARIRGKAVI